MFRFRVQLLLCHLCLIRNLEVGNNCPHYPLRAAKRYMRRVVPWSVPEHRRAAIVSSPTTNSQSNEMRGLQLYNDE
eukprot:6208739-Pleurochrysis_carterae.AAC.2